jgi:RNA polymerase sigma-70 factor, ECF subfamily
VETWEGHLVTRAQRGDALAFEHLMDLHGQSVRNHAYRLLRNGDDVEDAVQETFVKAFRAIKGFDARRPLLPWLMRICGNCCIDIVRDRKRQAESLDLHEHAIADTGESVDESVEARASARRIDEAIRRLPERYRKVLDMRHSQQKSVSEIAAMTGAPEGTVKSWLFRARALLARDLNLAASV